MQLPVPLSPLPQDLSLSCHGSLPVPAPSPASKCSRRCCLQDSAGNFDDCRLTLQPAVVRTAAQPHGPISDVFATANKHPAAENSTPLSNTNKRCALAAPEADAAAERASDT